MKPNDAAQIPRGARVVARVLEGTDQTTGRPSFRDYVGHVLGSSDTALDLMRDAAANGSRPEQRVSIPICAIIALKPVPERPTPERSDLRQHGHQANKESTTN